MKMVQQILEMYGVLLVPQLTSALLKSYSPGASVPFGMAKFTTDNTGYAPAGYVADPAERIRGLSPLHDSGTGSSLGMSLHHLFYLPTNELLPQGPTVTLRLCHYCVQTDSKPARLGWTTV